MRIKKIIWNILEWIDNEINHGIVEKIFDLFPLETKSGEDSFSFKLWQNTCYKFCSWVNATLYQRWKIYTNEEASHGPN